MDKKAKIFVAGASGLVGSAIVRRLRHDGYTNLVLASSKEVDLTRQIEVEEYFKKEQPEYVFLAAAKVGGILANMRYPAEFIYINSSIATNVIHSAYLYNVKKLINLGSSCIYPKLAPQPIVEEALLSSPLEETNESYAVAKILAIKLCSAYNRQYGTNFISVMPTNLYGQGDTFNMETAHLLPMLIRRFHLAKLLELGQWNAIIEDLQRYPIGWGYSVSQDITREELLSLLSHLGVYKDHVVVWGDGLVYRELMNSDDMADACIYLMKYKDVKDIGECVNITSGEDILLRDLFSLVQEIVGFSGEIRFDITKPNGTPRKRMSADKINSLGWSTTMNIAKGIEEFYSWYIQSDRGDRDIL